MDDTERLVVLLEARIRDFERNMQKASGTSAREFGRMRRDAQTASAAMEEDMVRASGRINQAMATVSTRAGAMAAAFAPAAGGIGIAAAALTGVGAAARTAARDIATIGDEAKRAGIGVKAFQELKYVADRSRVSIDALTDGIKEMNLRADEFIVTGSGSGAEAFKRLGFTASELAAKLKDPSALFTEIIGKLEHLDRAAQIRIADEVFGGTGGEQFVQLIEQGEAGIRRTIDEANRLGIVMDEAMIKRAAEVDRQFNAISRTVETNLKGAIVNAASALAGFIDGFREFENQQNQTLEAGLASLGLQRLETEKKILELRQNQRDLTDTARGLGFGEANDREIQRLEAENAALTEQEAKILDILRARGAFGQSTKEAADGLRELSTSGTAAAESLGYVERNGGGAAAGIASTGSAATKAASELDAFLAKADRLGEVQFPGEYARREAERLAADLDRFGGKLDDYQRAAIETEIAGLGKGISAEFREADESIARFEEGAGRSFEVIGATFQDEVGSVFADVFDAATQDGENFADGVVNAFAQLGRRLASAGFDRLLGSVFGNGTGAGSAGTFAGPTTRFSSSGAYGYSAPAAKISVSDFASASGQMMQYASRFNSNVDGRLLKILNEASSRFDMRVEAISGLRPGDSRFHGRGMATDVQIYDGSGRALGNYQDASTFRVYERFAQLSKKVQSELFPELEGMLRWGGYFSGGRGKYGALDTMHFDLGGRVGMGGGSWEGGLNSTMRQLWPGAESAGIGGQEALARAVSAGYVDGTRKLVTGVVPGLISGPRMSSTAATAMDAGWDGFSHNGAGGGFFQSPLFQGGLTALGAGMAGYQSGDPLGGALGGAMAGLSTGNPIMAAVGGVAGPIGGRFGSKKRRAA